MLKPIKTKICNHEFGAPFNWDASVRGECIPLPVYHDKGNSTFYSYWELTDEERKRIADGAHIILGVVGNGHPPVSVNVSNEVIKEWKDDE